MLSFLLWGVMHLVDLLPLGGIGFWAWLKVAYQKYMIKRSLQRPSFHLALTCILCRDCVHIWLSWINHFVSLTYVIFSLIKLTSSFNIFPFGSIFPIWFKTIRAACCLISLCSLIGSLCMNAFGRASNCVWPFSLTDYRLIIIDVSEIHTNTCTNVVVLVVRLYLLVKYEAATRRQFA